MSAGATVGQEGGLSKPELTQVRLDQELMQPVWDFLGCRTPLAWLEAAVQDVPMLLQDHANCEKKAAGTALNLMYRYSRYTELQVRLAQLVREEMLHYEQVLEIMQARGQDWMAVEAGRYAKGLRQHMRTHEPATLVDVLLIGALVEARSCERFAALMPYVDEELAKFYRYLLKSEARHFQDYVQLATQAAIDACGDEEQGQAEVSARLALLRAEEQRLIETPDPLLRFHSGVPVAA